MPTSVARETIESLPNHINLFLSVNPKGWMIIALNKSDLVEEEKLDKLLQSNQFEEQERVITVYSTSAKTGDNVDLIFQDLSSKIMDA